MICSILIGTNACSQPPRTLGKDQHSAVSVQPSLQQLEPGTVRFDIKVSSEMSNSANAQLYDCTYQAQGKTSKFRLEFKHYGE